MKIVFEHSVTALRGLAARCWFFFGWRFGKSGEDQISRRSMHCLLAAQQRLGNLQPALGFLSAGDSVKSGEHRNSQRSMRNGEVRSLDS